MAQTGRTSFLPPALDPASGWDITMRGVVGGDPRFFDYGRFGILNDNSVMRARVEGAAQGAPNSTWATGGSSGSFRTSWGGGGESDPGGYNYKTLANTAGTTAQLLGTAANFAMDRRPGADPDLDFRFGNTPIYNKYRGKQQKIERINRIRSRQQARAAQSQPAQPSPSAPYTGAIPTSFPSNPGLNIEQAQSAAQSIQSQYGTDIAREQNPALKATRRPGFNAAVNILNTNRSSNSNQSKAPYDPGSIWASDAPDDESYSYDTGQSGDNFWSNLSSMNTQQGGPAMSGTTQQTSTRPTGAAGASQRPNQPRNRGRGPRNRGFGKRL